MYEAKPTVVEALLSVMGEVQAIGKKDRNAQQGYSFRGIDATVNAVGPAFRKHGVICLPLSCEAHYRDATTTTGKQAREVTVIVSYRFYGPAGDYLDCQVPGESMDSGDKGSPKAMSVAYRTGLLQALCIPTDEPEPDSQTFERAPDPARAIRHMYALCKEIGLIGDPAREFFGLVVGRHLETSKDLSTAEVDQVVEALSEWKRTGTNPMAGES